MFTAKRRLINKYIVDINSAVDDAPSMNSFERFEDLKGTLGDELLV